MSKEDSIEPILIPKGNKCLLINGNPPLVDCRIVAEDEWEKRLNYIKQLEHKISNLKIIINSTYGQH